MAAKKVWQLPQAKSLDPTAVYDGLRLHEIVFRFPDGAMSGGEVQVARLRAGAAMVQPMITVAFEPGEPDALLDVLMTFLDPILARAGVTGAGTTLQDPPAPVAPKPAKEPSMGTL